MLDGSASVWLKPSDCCRKRAAGGADVGRFCRLSPTSTEKSSALERRLHQGARLVDQLRQVVPAPEALGVDLVEVLGPRGAGGEPATLRGDLHPADLGVVGRRPG